MAKSPEFDRPKHEKKPSKKPDPKTAQAAGNLATKKTVKKT